MRWENLLPDLDLAIFVRAFYLLSALAILSVRLVPPLQARFLDYGARQSDHKADSTSNANKPLTVKLLDFVARVNVSHTRFSDFYVLSLLCLAFWVSQIYNEGIVNKYLCNSVCDTSHGSSRYRVGLCLLLFAMQSLRRLYECLSLSPGPSSSSMWIGHYLIGLAFYFFTNIALFVDQIHASSGPSQLNSLLSPVRPSMSLLDLLALLTFITASAKQHNFHKYLASLKKYTLPDSGAFQYIVAPHYTAECLIYLSLSILSSGKGQLVSRSMLCAAIFVVVNLGVTAEGTKRWMLGKFPDRRDEIKKRWRMVPEVF